MKFVITILLIIIITNVRSENELKHYAHGGSKLAYLGLRVYNKPNKEASERVRAWRKGYKENPEFLGTYAEGDILFYDKQAPARNSLINETKRWPLGIVPYEINNRFGFIQQYAIWRAMVTFEKEACIRFRPKTKHDNDWILIDKEDAGCFSSIGRTRGKQIVNLETPNCLRCGTIMHELMHVIGFAHEQSRSDRDEYIDIALDNVDESMKHNFDKCSPNEYTFFGMTYDYTSLMHYSNFAFTRNSLETMVAKDGVTRLGLANYFSKLDIEKIKLMYKCGATKVIVYRQYIYLLSAMLFYFN